MKFNKVTSRAKCLLERIKSCESAKNKLIYLNIGDIIYLCIWAAKACWSSDVLKRGIKKAVR